MIFRRGCKEAGVMATAGLLALGAVIAGAGVGVGNAQAGTGRLAPLPPSDPPTPAVTYDLSLTLPDEAGRVGSGSPTVAVHRTIIFRVPVYGPGREPAVVGWWLAWVDSIPGGSVTLYVAGPDGRVFVAPMARAVEALRAVMMMTPDPPGRGR